MLKLKDDGPFVYCSCCGEEFDPELINQYEFDYCPYCAADLKRQKSLWLVLSSGPIDALYFDPDEPIPTAREILQRYILAAFSSEDEANAYAHDYGFEVLKIDEWKPEMPNGELLFV